MELNKDVYFKIGKYLNNKGKLHLSATSKEMDQLKFIFLYKDRVDIDRIVDLPYYDNFENIASSFIQGSAFPISRNLTALINKGRLPKSLKYHHYTSNTLFFFLEVPEKTPCNTLMKRYPFSNSNLYCFQNVPFSVTHLTFVDFNQSLDNAIPSTVTHLDFGNEFNQAIIDCIPPSVTHLSFGNNFSHLLCRNSIPTSVKHLILGEQYVYLVPSCILLQLDSLSYGRYSLMN